MNRPNAVTIDQTTAQLVWKINAFLETIYNNYIHQNSSDSNFARRDLTIHQNDFIDQNNVIQTDVFSDNVLITRTMLLA
ncbi:5543_t:CDS:2 [Entrophospora sp. SA101]|nr:5543_t:CDS:2 [Entrophospora sp. SA101]